MRDTRARGQPDTGSDLRPRYRPGQQDLPENGSSVLTARCAMCRLASRHTSSVPSAEACGDLLQQPTAEACHLRPVPFAPRY